MARVLSSSARNCDSAGPRSSPRISNKSRRAWYSAASPPAMRNRRARSAPGRARPRRIRCRPSDPAPGPRPPAPAPGPGHRPPATGPAAVDPDAQPATNLREAVCPPRRCGRVGRQPRG
jgi:hypothetical protein